MYFSVCASTCQTCFISFRDTDDDDDDDDDDYNNNEKKLS